MVHVGWSHICEEVVIYMLLVCCWWIIVVHCSCAWMGPVPFHRVVDKLRLLRCILLLVAVRQDESPVLDAALI